MRPTADPPYRSGVDRRHFLLTSLAGAVAAPLAVRAQPPERVYRIAGVTPGTAAYFLDETTNPRWQPFFEELRRQGFVEGRNLAVERYAADGHADRHAELARRVVAGRPDVIFGNSDRLAAHLKAATATIPIVAVASDPVAFGLVPSLAHPGGNVTGVAPDGGLQFYAKHLELLREVAPTATRIAYLTPRAVWESPILLAPVREAARRMGISLLPAPLVAPIHGPEYRRAFTAMARARADGLIVGQSSENYAQMALVIELATRARLPAIYPDRRFAQRGGLLSYGVEFPDLYRHAGAQIGRILKGANPGDIPFYQASRFDLVINVKTAEALGLTIPPSLLARADHVIQ